MHCSAGNSNAPVPKSPDMAAHLSPGRRPLERVMGWLASGGRIPWPRAGERDGARACRPNCVRTFSITGRPRMAAMIFSSPGQFGQRSRPRSNGRLSSRSEVSGIERPYAQIASTLRLAWPERQDRALAAPPFADPCRRECSRKPKTQQHGSTTHLVMSPLEFMRAPDRLGVMPVPACPRMFSRCLARAAALGHATRSSGCP